MSEEQAAVGQFVVKCPKCGEGHSPGIFRCTKCNTSLRPTFLGLITLLGAMRRIFGATFLLVQIAHSQIVRNLDLDPVAVVAFSINVAAIFVLNGLRTGKYWAWQAIQVIWVIDIAFSVIYAIAIYPAMFPATVVLALIIVLLWIYIYSERVKAFCSVGRPSK